MGQEQVLRSSYHLQGMAVVRKQNRLALASSHLDYAGSAGTAAAENRCLDRPISVVEYNMGALSKPLPLADLGAPLEFGYADQTPSLGRMNHPLLSSSVRHPSSLPLPPLPTGVGASYIQPTSSSSRGHRRASARCCKKSADRPAPIAEQCIGNAPALEAEAEVAPLALGTGDNAEVEVTASEDGVGGIAGGEQSNDQGIIVVQETCGEGSADGSSWEGVSEKWRSRLKTWAVKGVECVSDVVETTVVYCVRGLRIAETTMLPFLWLISPHRCSPFVWT